jgi:RNA polymerase sigma factor
VQEASINGLLRILTKEVCTMEENQLVMEAAKDEKAFDRLFEKNRKFIVRCAFKASKRYITTSDDEWSIALSAFSDAVTTYDVARGSFHKYAERVISNRLVDYYRAQRKHSPEIYVSPEVLEGNSDSKEWEDAGIPIDAMLDKNSKSDIAYEIEAVSHELKGYGFSFFDLTECSPKSIKTKDACRKAVRFILDTPDLAEEIRQSKLLPIKKIQKDTDLPRKLLEHHRKYIIAVVEILSGEYPYLAEYVSYIRKAGD